MENKKAVRKSGPIDALLLPPEAPVYGNILGKLIYGYLHHELPIEDVYNFYAQLPGISTVLDRNPTQFFNHLWDEQTANSSQEIGLIVNAFEQTLYSNNKSIDSFHHFIKASINFQSDLFTSSIFPAFQPLLSRIGMKEFLLQNAHLIPPCILPDVTTKLIAFKKNNSGSSATIAIFTNRINAAPPIDIDLVLGPICRFFPLLFGASPFTNYIIICDEISIGNKLKGFTAATTEHETVVIDNKKIGRANDFSSFIAARGLPDEGTAFPGKRVIIADYDVYCQKRQRIVIHKDCAYDAPVSIIKLFQSPEPYPETGPGKLTFEKHTTPWPNIYKKHYLLQSKIDPASRIHVRFNSRMQSISINGRHLISGISAKILCFIVKTYTESEVVEFEWSDLAANRELVSHPSNTGLTTRLNRISKCLFKTATGITLEKFGHGKYRLSSTKPLSFSEV
jgi:hypothetical protein